MLLPSLTCSTIATMQDDVRCCAMLSFAAHAQRKNSRGSGLTIDIPPLVLVNERLGIDGHLEMYGTLLDIGKGRVTSLT